MDEQHRKETTLKLVPGARVSVTQQIPMRERVWSQEIKGIVIAYEQRPTGSWYAHAKDDRLWLDRLVIRKADGEISTLNLDEYTSLVVDSPAADAKVVSA